MASAAGGAPGHPALLRLLQLASPSLPVGAYAYSQGLEYAVAAGWVTGEADAADWILGRLGDGLGRLEVPVLARLYPAWQRHDPEAIDHWSRFLGACRESSELLAEDRQAGSALARLLVALGLPRAAPWITAPHTGFATVFALAAADWEIPLADAACGLLWSWADNQVAAAIKLVPLGQTAGQRILSRAVAEIPVVVARGLALPDGEIGAATAGVGLASLLHETQYTRLFRS